MANSVKQLSQKHSSSRTCLCAPLL